jgi:pimeloyl-ACP methyl ester carboxylesterase
VHGNGINLHVVQAGPADGPLAILLHGFPEFWYSWRRQIPALANAGFCVWAPDQRGFNLSDKPEGLDAYALDNLVADVIGLIDAAGRTRAHIVGHDWGAAVTWRIANRFPQRVATASILNVPHPLVMAKYVQRSLRQALRSSYFAFFQLPALPEKLLRANNWQLMVAGMRRSSPPGLFSEADMQAYRQAWSQPGALTGMLNWYRAGIQRPLSWSPSPRVEPPLLMLWGAKDTALERELAPLSLELCDHGRLHYLEEASHWVQHEAPGAVNRLLLEHLTSGAG